MSPTRRRAAASPPPLADEVEAVHTASMALVELTLAALAGATDLSVLQARVLLAVERHRPANLAELAALMDMAPPGASRVVSRLVAAGLLSRRETAHDRREVSVHLTPKGRRTLTRLGRARAEALADPLGRMAAEDRAALASGLARFREATER